MQGRKPHSEQFKVLSGTESRYIKKTPKPRPAIRLPKPPDWLGVHGKRFYRRAGKRLISAHSFAELDISAFTTLAASYNIIVECNEKLQEEGLVVSDARGSSKKNPLTSILRGAETTFTKLASEFGLTPCGRERLNLQPRIEDEPGWDLLT